MTVSGRQRREFWIGFGVFLVIVMSMIVGAVWLFKTLIDEQRVPLSAVIIQGERTYTTDAEVVAAITEGEVGSFFSADADELLERIQALPWIYSVSMRREWPGRLRIYLVEQEAVAVWNEQALVNKDGRVFAGDPARVEKLLPRMRGPETDVEEVYRQFRRMQTLLAQGGLTLTQIELSQRFSVRLWIDDDIELRLGREARLERVQRFMDMLPLIRAEDERAIAYVDLRYDTGAAVGWRDNKPGE
ncbi:MAG: cell division protein FtsQ/DivIB [Idiomarina sp.]|nr:cell division protein FtsQ/DivIB [Idiomarina sp.]